MPSVTNSCAVAVGESMLPGVILNIFWPFPSRVPVSVMVKPCDVPGLMYGTSSPASKIKLRFASSLFHVAVTTVAQSPSARQHQKPEQKKASQTLNDSVVCTGLPLDSATTTDMGR